jgi:CDP-4-dehydro-6-deoxyglucose reductase
MTFQISIEPSGHTFPANGEDTLLQAALDAGLTLPYGCRNGACGACKGKVLRGAIDHGKAQDYVLSPAERSAGMALFCCAKPASDVVIECHEVRAVSDIPVKTFPCRVQRMERVATDVMVLYLKLPANERLQFLAGQYIDILLKDGRRRAFSLAHAPHDDEFLQLHVRKIAGGQFTTHVFETMKERDILRLEGPHGNFRVRDNIDNSDEGGDKPIIYLAGGTGFAPIKAMVEHAIHHGVVRPIQIYWGARDRAGLYLHDLPSLWAAEYALISYVPVLSEATAADAWNGRTGFVHRAVLDDHADLSGHQVYACGAPAMIDAAKRDFAARGLPADQFFADAFTFAADAAMVPA